MLEFVDVALSYERGLLLGSGSGRVDALRDVSFRVEGGAFCLLSGPSGAGKTSLLHLVLGLRMPDKGTVCIAGRSLHRLSAASLPYVRRNIGAVFQDLALLPRATPLRNVAMALEVWGHKRKDIREQARAALEQVEIDPDLRRPVAHLSGGEQQRVALARALATRPPLLLADEPTSNLDPRLRAEIMRLLGLVRDSGTTVVVASHDPWLCEHPIIDQVVTLDCGVVMGVEVKHRRASGRDDAVADAHEVTLAPSSEVAFDMETLH